MGKLTNEVGGDEPEHYSWIYDPKQADGKPRPVLNSAEDLARIHAVLDAHYGRWNEGGQGRAKSQIARVALLPPEIVKPALPPGEKMTAREARALLHKAVEAAGGVRPLAALHGQGHALISKALARKRKLGLSVLRIIGLTPDQVIPDPELPEDEV